MVWVPFNMTKAHQPPSQGHHQPINQLLSQQSMSEIKQDLSQGRKWRPTSRFKSMSQIHCLMFSTNLLGQYWVLYTYSAITVKPHNDPLQTHTANTNATSTNQGENSLPDFLVLMIFLGCPQVSQAPGLEQLVKFKAHLVSQAPSQWCPPSSAKCNQSSRGNCAQPTPVDSTHHSSDKHSQQSWCNCTWLLPVNETPPVDDTNQHSSDKCADQPFKHSCAQFQPGVSGHNC